MPIRKTEQLNGLHIASDLPEQEVVEMNNKLPRFQKVNFVLGAAMGTLLCLPGPMHAQSSTTQETTQDRQAVQTSNPQDRQAVASDDRGADRRDVANFNRFLDEHREVAEQVRKDPSLLDNRTFVQNHPALQTYLQNNPGVREQLSQNPNGFMRQEDAYSRDSNMRDRDGAGQDRNASGQDRDAAGQDRNANGQDRDAAGQDRNANGQDRDAAGQDRNANGQDRDAAGQDRNANGQDRDAAGQDRNANGQDRDAAGQDRDANGQDRDARGQDRRDVANFNRFLDEHHEVAEQVRKDPSLLDNRTFVQNHPALQTYLQNNPGVRGQLSQNPNGFMRQEDAYNRNSNMRESYNRDSNMRDSNDRDRDPTHDHMAGFGGFLHSHSDIQNDLSKDPSVVKDHGYVQNHAELDAYLKANPGVRTDLMANPQSFVQGARQYNNASPSGTSSGAGVSGRGTTGTATGTTGTATGTTGTSTSPATTPHEPAKPNQ
jgi:hypothetical protein